ncbi:arsenic efflux protein [bacterium]|nr:arsenic efflux protein [bacterium]
MGGHHHHIELNVLSILFETVKIIGIVFTFMVIVELVELKFSNFLKRNITKNRHMQYLVASLFGIIPGCAGTFAMSSFYMSGIIGFGGIVAVMVSTFGDEAFVLMASSPKIFFILAGITFLLGIISGYIADFIKKLLNFEFNKRCCIHHHFEDEKKSIPFLHFLKEHVWVHIIKKHLPKIFLWLFFSLLVIAFLNEHIHLKETVIDNRWYLLVLAGLVGILPISGPNLFFMMLYLSGKAPFSILLVSSIVQDGHGLLPVIGYSIQDAFKIKIFNVIFGLAIGSIVMLLGF